MIELDPVSLSLFSGCLGENTMERYNEGADGKRRWRGGGGGGLVGGGEEGK